MWKVSGSVSPGDFERAVRAMIATPDRRGPDRESLDGVAEIVYAASGRRARGVTVDLGEGGLSVICALEPELGERLLIELAGLVVEGRVRHVAREGAIYRIGVEAA